MGAHAASWIRRENDEIVLVSLRTRTLDGSPVPAVVEGILCSDVMVVVASLDEPGLLSSAHWGIVPFGHGRLLVNEAIAPNGATVSIHSPEGVRSRSDVASTAAGLCIPVMAELEDGTPAELFELWLHASPAVVS